MPRYIGFLGVRREKERNDFLRGRYDQIKRSGKKDGEPSVKKMLHRSKSRKKQKAEKEKSRVWCTLELNVNSDKDYSSDISSLVVGKKKKKLVRITSPFKKEKGGKVKSKKDGVDKFFENKNDRQIEKDFENLSLIP